MRVVATAGHVDHGKSTLVRALTGRDPDRWAEERRRGLTIDLGYAWTTLPTGEQVAFVDVPGHQRFIGNMLAGLGPAPAVLLCVAADEGWRPQSQEHLDAASALGIERGLLVITRADLADPHLALARARSALARTPLTDVESVAVSAVTGAGLDDLRAALGRLCAALPTPELTGRVRLWIDRAFTIAGAGTVVTGTLGAGTIRVGDALELAGRQVIVRGMESLDSPVAAATAVARVALNVRGIGADAVGRGDVLLAGRWHTTSVVDVRLTSVGNGIGDSLGGERYLVVGNDVIGPQSPENGNANHQIPSFVPRPAAGIDTNDATVPASTTSSAVTTGQSAPATSPAASSARLPERLVAHVGTAAVPVRLRPLGPDAVRLTFERPLPLTAGDRMVLRDPGRAIVAGALVLDADPPPLTRRGAARARAEAVRDHTGLLDPAVEVGRRGAMRVSQLIALGADPADLVPQPQHRVGVGSVRSGADLDTPAPPRDPAPRRLGDWMISPEQWSSWASALVAAVDAHAAAHPLKPRMPERAAADALHLPDPGLITALSAAAGLTAEGGHLGRPGVRADLGPAEAAVAELERRLGERPFAAPERDDLAALGLDPKRLATAVRLGRLLDLGDQVLLAPDAPARAMRVLAGLPQPFTAAQAKDALATTRRVAIPLLEHLDRRGWTRRLDAGRREVVRRPPGETR